MNLPVSFISGGILGLVSARKLWGFFLAENVCSDVSIPSIAKMFRLDEHISLINQNPSRSVKDKIKLSTFGHMAG